MYIVYIGSKLSVKLRVTTFLSGLPISQAVCRQEPSCLQKSDANAAAPELTKHTLTRALYLDISHSCVCDYIKGFVMKELKVISGVSVVTWEFTLNAKRSTLKITFHL